MWQERVRAPTPPPTQDPATQDPGGGERDADPEPRGLDLGARDDAPGVDADVLAVTDPPAPGKDDQRGVDLGLPRRWNHYYFAP